MLATDASLYKREEKGRRGGEQGKTKLRGEGKQKGEKIGEKGKRGKKRKDKGGDEEVEGKYTVVMMATVWANSPS